MAKETTMNGRLGHLRRLASAMVSNREELQHLEPSRARFEAVLNQTLEAADRQALHTAGKQEATQQLQNLLAEGERLATILRLAVKQHFGIRAEKLTEFGLQPFRGRPRKAPGQPEEPQTPTPAPVDPKRPAPPQTPETDR
ncbi:MAG TPA: hypothetical protein VHC97_20935 [Thermoanaerobaculia bacterium]|jgi:hypothetical protein|nr:hypothetical protein [Thermoanaerobaculia bacterium]